VGAGNVCRRFRRALSDQASRKCRRELTTLSVCVGPHESLCHEATRTRSCNDEALGAFRSGVLVRVTGACEGARASVRALRDGVPMRLPGKELGDACCRAFAGERSRGSPCPWHLRGGVRPAQRPNRRVGRAIYPAVCSRSQLRVSAHRCLVRGRSAPFGSRRCAPGHELAVSGGFALCAGGSDLPS
jgi:hypothetical protein